jgi:hypothetical protein
MRAETWVYRDRHNLFLGTINASISIMMNALLMLILTQPQALRETQVPCCLRGVWLQALADLHPEA